MTQEYTYSDSDFIAVSGKVDNKSLQDEVWTNVNITSLFAGIRSSLLDDGTYTVIFVFDAAITAPEQTELDGIVAAHLGTQAAPASLDVAKSKAKENIDAAAGDARAKYVTVTPGQDAVYVAKEKEAQAHKDASYPTDLADYPFIEAEINAQGYSTAQEASDSILAIADSWKGIAASIEEIRLDYKNQVDAETNEDTVRLLGRKAVALLHSI